MLQQVLAVFNVDQSQALPPFIYSSMYNAVSSLLLSKLAALYPASPLCVDMLEPFIERKVLPVTAGVIKLPDGYRNLLGSPQINAKSDGSAECTQTSKTTLTETEFKQLSQKSGCRKRPVIIVPESEFAFLTTSTYKQPNYMNPIGYFSGKREITVCPGGVLAVEVMFAKNEKTYRYGYITQPDDTYIFDAATSIESEWTNPAFQPLFKGICACYAAYSRDESLQNWSNILNQTEIL